MCCVVTPGVCIGSQVSLQPSRKRVKRTCPRDLASNDSGKLTQTSSNPCAG